MSTAAVIQEKKKHHLNFPSAFTILFFIMILAIVATWVVPAGSYSKLVYDSENQVLMLTDPHGAVSTMPATQESLDKINVHIQIDQFTEGKINKAVAVPGTYERLPQAPKSLLDLTVSMVNGTIEAVDVMVFIFVLGGLIGIVNATGAFNAGLLALSKRSKGHEFLFVFLVSILMVLGGTTCGIEEEAVAFYPILVPIFLALGYDSIICVGAIFLASSMGTTFSTINPFSVVIASSAAGIPFTEGIAYRVFGCIVGAAVVIAYLYWYGRKVEADPTFSYTYDDHEKFQERFPVNLDESVIGPFNWRKKLVLLLFAAGFPIMIWGVSVGGWWFPEMAASFLAFAIVIIFISGLNEHSATEAFTRGASGLVGVSLIIGLARGVNLIMEQGLISDTVLYYASNAVSGMEGGLFAISIMLIFFLLGFIVPSSSGLAVLSMPIMAPLADTVDIPRYIVVSAYNWGQYAMLYLAPTGLVLATLQMLGMKYNHWLKFVWPMVVFLLVFGGILLVIQVMLA